MIYYFAVPDSTVLNEIRLTWAMKQFDCTEKYCRSSGSISYSCIAAVALRSADCAAGAVNRSTIRDRWLAELRGAVRIDPLDAIVAFV
ncbi:hypothetical protein [Burkholderia anthina]|uniref:hypothetical protein n=1 Tax=Burkholderia anthina TaxID=179879 RepID=UPI0037BE7F8E